MQLCTAPCIHASACATPTCYSCNRSKVGSWTLYDPSPWAVGHISEALLHTLMHCILDSACYTTPHHPLHPCLHTCHPHLFVCLFVYLCHWHTCCLFVCLFPLPDCFH